MKKMKCLLAVALLSYSVIANAQQVGDFYAEAAYKSFENKDTAVNAGTWKSKAAQITFGTVLLDNLAIEGFFANGTSESAIPAGGGSLKIKATYGLTVRPFVNVTENIELFGRVGVAKMNSDWYDGSGGTNTSKATNGLVGVGVAYKISERVKAVVDYTKFSNEDMLSPSAFAIGLRYSF